MRLAAAVMPCGMLDVYFRYSGMQNSSCMPLKLNGRVKLGSKYRPKLGEERACKEEEEEEEEEEKKKNINSVVLCSTGLAIFVYQEHAREYKQEMAIVGSTVAEAAVFYEAIGP